MLLRKTTARHHARKHKDGADSKATRHRSSDMRRVDALQAVLIMTTTPALRCATD